MHDYEWPTLYDDEKGCVVVNPKYDAWLARKKAETAARPPIVFDHNVCSLCGNLRARNA